MDKNVKKDTPTNNKKWSFGRFFRKKKDLETESSSDDDQKAGFVAQKPRKKDKRKRTSKIVSPGFDHIVISPRENEIFLPFETIDTTESHRSSGSLDRRARNDRKQRSSRLKVHANSSSEDEAKSHNSSTLSRYRSDESIGSAGVVGSRRSRAARTERYYKRISRDENGNSPSMAVTQQVGRWKTQPIELEHYDYNHRPVQGYYMKNSTSMSNVPNDAPPQWNYSIRHKPNQYSPVSAEKRSISYDNHIHLQNITRKDPSIKSPPPPPPPRDPQRRLHVSGQNDTRPISYAFDKNHAPMYAMNSRCVSDDKLWGPNGSIYQSNIQRPASAQPAPQPRRFITRNERDASRNQANNPPVGLDYKYVADAIPRSRKPIHIMKPEEPKLEPSPNSAFVTSPAVIRTTRSGLPSPMKAASSFWKKIDQEESQRRGRNSDIGRSSGADKLRSTSSSRANDGLGYRNYVQESFRNKNARMNKSVDEVDNIVNGSLYLKPTKDNEKNFIEISSKPYENKSNSMPNYYQQQRQPLVPMPATMTPPPNKYEEYIARKAIQSVIKPPVKVPPAPPQRKSFKISSDDLRKPTNLEDAINELDAIYKSLKLGDEDLMDRAERRDIPTPTNFEKYAVLSDEDEDQSNGEPDVVLDDVAYRNIKRANTMIKTIEPQPPFGIPIGPVPPSSNTDYLHVTPEIDSKKKNRCVPHNVPDLVTDDMAVRTLRKDVPGQVKPNVVGFPAKKKRAVRSMSANIYNLIQRDAAKPSGGSMFDYGELDRALSKAGSLSDVRRDVDDVPSTLSLLRNIRRDDKEANRKSPPVFRHPSQGGAVFNLPSTLKTSPRDSPYIAQKPPIPLPRKSISPEPMHSKSGMEEVLNQIAKEARESSEKLSRDLIELRNGKINSNEKPINPEISKMDKDIEEVSKAAKICEELLLDVVPPAPKPLVPEPKPRKLSREEKLIKDIDEVSEAAKVCEMILQNVVTTEPPVTIEMAQVVQNKSIEREKSIERFITSTKVDQSINKPSDSHPIEIDLIDLKDDDDLIQQEEQLVVASLLEKLDPIQSDRIGAIAARCMRQISQLSDLRDEEVIAADDDLDDDIPDYDNLNPEIATDACKDDRDDIPDYDNIQDDSSVVVSGQLIKQSTIPTTIRTGSLEDDEDIDKIMKECEENVNKTPHTSLSSSDCHKSSSPTSSRHQSSSITSIHAFSSSDYVKSPSSEFYTPSTDPIKTFSTTSYDVNSSSVTPNITNSPISSTPSPPLALTPIGNEIAANRNSSQSQYNSSEELAMIFGISPAATATSLAPLVSTTNSTSTTTSTTGNTTPLAIINANACDHNVAIITNNNPIVAISTTSAVVVDACTTITTTTTTSIMPSSTTTVEIILDDNVVDDNECCRFYSQSQHQHDNGNFITIASYSTPETCKHIRLVPSPSTNNAHQSCLDTIPELHDDFVDDFENVDDFVASTKNCMIHQNDNVDDNDDDDDDDDDTKISLSSNPDSGNVSLSDFPVQQQSCHDHSINTSLELSLFHNSNFTYSNRYSFINQINIETANDDDQDLDDDNDNDNRSRLRLQQEQNIDDSHVVESIDARLESENRRDSMQLVELRNRMPIGTFQSNSSCAMSRNSGSDHVANDKQSKYLARPQGRQSFLQHFIIACTCGVASNDFYTYLAIAIAMITIIVIILL